MPYFLWSDLVNEIPEDFAIQALDEAGTATVAADVADAFAALRTAASEDVDSYLEGRYAVPLTGTIPLAVKRGAVLIAAKTCYARRGSPERFPKPKELEAALRTLEKIRDGKTQLTPGRASDKPRGAVITGVSRVHATNDRLGS
jgi:phage gp36-like protein